MIRNVHLLHAGSVWPLLGLFMGCMPGPTPAPPIIQDLPHDGEIRYTLKPGEASIPFKLPIQHPRKVGPPHEEVAFEFIHLLGIHRVEHIENQIDAFNALSARGVEPVEGWHADRITTVGDAAIIAVASLGNPNQIDLDDPHAAIAELQSLGYTFGNMQTIYRFVRQIRSRPHTFGKKP